MSAPNAQARPGGLNSSGNGGDPAQIVKEKQSLQMTDVDAIPRIGRTKILERQPQRSGQSVLQAKTLLPMVHGQVARSTKGKADPKSLRRVDGEGLKSMEETFKNTIYKWLLFFNTPSLQSGGLNSSLC
ncbi:MAG: hypothetical protein IPG80_18480 [Anaerolineales bacterium]|nr:hypothetical protein [Anaerolineales bacterium]